jgi:hypothetical protein
LISERWPADRAEKDRLVSANAVLPVGRHHRAVLLVVIATGEVELIQRQADSEAARRRIERAQALGHHLDTDAVAGNDRDPMGC